MNLALTREISPAIATCELTHLNRVPIDLSRARAQHLAYEQALRRVGCSVERLPELPEFPDSVFVQDIAVVFDECAIVARPGAVSRRGEVDSVARRLQLDRTLHWIHSPGTLDGGDFVIIGRNVYVGISSRTNREGAEQLATFLVPLGYEVLSVPVSRCLHLMGAVSRVASDTLLINPAWVESSHFAGWRVVEIDATEPFAANALWVNDSVIFPLEFPRTTDNLTRAGIDVTPVAMSELAKAEGAVTCCSIVYAA
jgi:dimethylargininase